MGKNKKTKVLLCSPFGSRVGGISRWTGHILNYYKNNNTDIYLKQYYSDKAGAINSTSIISRVYIGITSYIPFIFGVHRELKNNKYNVVHFTSSASISLIRDIIALKIANSKGLKTIIHFHFGRIPELYKKRNWEQILMHRVIRLANKTIVIDQKSYDTLINEGYKNIELLPNPLTPRVSEIIGNNNHIIRENRKLTFAGHVVKKKGVFELVLACSQIKNIKLNIIGHVTNEMKRELVALVGNNDTKWLNILGELSFEETIKEMLSANVFVLPTYTEGFPNVIIESMACACPIVTTNVGAIPEMLDIQNGFNHGICVKPKDVDGLQKGIETMLEDREYAITCGENAQKRVNELYSMSKVWKQLEIIWSS